LGRSAVFKWHKRFAQGRNSLEDDEHTGQNWTQDPKSYNIGVSQPLPNSRWNSSSSSD
jgi:hypothetical protein